MYMCVVCVCVVWCEYVVVGWLGVARCDVMWVQYGDTPLHDACSEGQTDTVLFLIQVANANVHATNNVSVAMLVLHLFYAFCYLGSLFVT